MLPNIEQVKSAIAVFLAAAVPVIAFLVANGVPQNIAAIVTVVVILLALIGWVVWDNTHKNTIAAAASIPGIQEIRVADNAKGGAQAAVEDTKLPNVVPMSAPSS